MNIGGQRLKGFIANGLITPFFAEERKNHELKIGSNSIDVTLGNTILIMENKPIAEAIDLDLPLPDNIYTEVVISEKGYRLDPGDFILGAVMERFDINPTLKLVQHYDGRSTMARLGILSHVSAGFGDYGFNGAFTLEIKNLGNCAILLKPGMRIGQVYFQKVDGPIEYDGYTQSDFKPGLPRLGKDRF